MEKDETRYWHGIQLFNAREFFDAHEVLEDVWRTAASAEKPFLQGLIQIAVALHHNSTGNRVGAASLLARGERNLSSFPASYRGIDLAALRKAITAWREALRTHSAEPELPQIRMVGVS